ncbi:MAG TPA: adenylyl-sulfate kinase [Thermoplasmata archaeon]|nr:adenylyl-sulfate kinase [Thermoplasmata archaeon]
MERKGFTLWFTGLPSSGKSTLADDLADRMRGMGLKVERLDGDIVRKSLTKDLGFSREDRRKNLERVTFVAKLLSRNGVAVLCSFVSPYRDVRSWIRGEIDDFVLVYVKAPVEACIERDPKGNYRKALAGEIKEFTGVDDPYEEPEDAEIVVETTKYSVEECNEQIITKLRELGYLG